jgi:predicted permease
MSRRGRFFSRRMRMMEALDQDIRDFIERETQDNVERGMPPEEARYAALRKFGNVTRIREDTRDVWSFVWLEQLWQDIRFGLRTLGRNPGFATVAVATLALGIGVNAAIFSVMNVMLLEALPVKSPQDLVEFVRQDPDGTMMTNLPSAVFVYMRKDTRVLSGVFAFTSDSRVLHSSSGSETLLVHEVSGSFFPTLGVKPLLGRAIDWTDDLADSDRHVLVLSYPFWSSYFGRDPSVLGKTLHVNGALCTIVGVMPQGFFGVDRSTAPDMWTPFPPGPIDSQVWVLGRLKPGISIPQARAELGLLFHQALESLRHTYKDSPEQERNAFLGEKLLVNRAVRGTSGLRWYYWEYSNTLKILLGMTGVVLLIACLNLANLLMARSAARSQEIGIRLAVGAGRGRVLRQLLTENMLLALAGGATGLMVARSGHRVLVAFLVGNLEGVSLSFRLDPHILWFSFAVAILAGLLSGALPALRAVRGGLGPAIQVRGATRLPVARRLLVAQVALSLMLLVGAGLFVRSLRNLASGDLGLARENLFLMAVDPTPSKAVANKMNFWVQLTAHIAALPGVRSVSLAGDAVFGNGGWNAAIWFRQREGAEQEVRVPFNVVGPGFFGTVSIPLLAGREFGVQDKPNSPEVAVVNRAFGLKFFHGENPIGRRFGNAGPDSTAKIEVVGVIADAKYGGLREQPGPMFYLPLFQNLEERLYQVHVRTGSDLPGVIAAVRREVQNMDQDISVYPAQTIPGVVRRLLQHDRMFAVLGGAFGLLALLLTSVGLYGLVTYHVARRTNEIGIRMALGAQRRDILWNVLSEALLLIVFGVGIGLPAAIAAGGAVRSILFGLQPSDPVTILLAVATLVGVGGFAAFLPARRATKVDPMVALRYE